MGLGRRASLPEASEAVVALLPVGSADLPYDAGDGPEWSEPNRRLRSLLHLRRPGLVRLWLAVGASFTVLLVLVGSKHPHVQALASKALEKLPPDLKPRPPTYEIDWRTPVRPRGTLTNAFGYRRPRPGTDAWRALYPARTLGPEPRQQWLDRYHHLRSQPPSVNPFRRTASVPRATLNLQNGLAQYPDGVDFSGSEAGICSYRRATCLRGPNEDFGEDMEDVWYGKQSTWAVNFDDGPLPPTRTLLDYLERRQQLATHFMIGSNVRDYPDLALAASSLGMHLAVHTYSHPHLTTLTDEQVIGELGWTMQIIADLTGKVPRYYRPPYGDVDNRIRALAKHVLGLTTVLWNGDSVDWSLNLTLAIGDFVDPVYPDFTLSNSLNNILARAKEPRSNGVGAIILEHELSDESVEAFMRTFGEVRELGWRTKAVPDCIGAPWYQE